MSAPGIQTQTIDVRGGGGQLYVVRDLLDKQLVDRHHEPMGRADGVVMHISDNQPPRVTCIESGMTIWAARVNGRIGRWVRAAARRWGLSRGRPVRIAWSRVMCVGIETELDLEADETRALIWEHWLLAHVVRFIPSLKPPDKKKQASKPPSEKSTTPPTSVPPPPDQPSRGRRLRVQHLLGRKVLDSTGRTAGRIEEVRTQVRYGVCEVESFEIGKAGLRERLSISGVSLALVRGLGARGGMPARGHHIPWRQLDLEDARHPRLRCTIEELASLR